MPSALPSFLAHYFRFDALSVSNTVFLLGLVLFLGSLGGFLFKKLKIPQVVGYIVIGIAIGSSGSRIIGPGVIASLDPLSTVALSLIGFLIGSELKIPVIRKYGKQFAGILLLEAIVPFFVVGALVFAVSYAFTRDARASAALGLLLGAICSATAPAATTDVLAENRAKGPLTTILIGIVAMDDAVALFLFAIASTVASGLLGSSSIALGPQLLSIAYSVFVSCAAGAATGFLLGLLIKRLRNDDGRVLAFSLGAVLLLAGLCGLLGLNTILAAMAMGFFIVNFVKDRSRELFALVDKFTPPIYVLFFVLVGAKLDIRSVTPYFALVAAVYVIGRTLGTSIGSTLGAKLTKAPATVRKYMKWCLLSQAGVAIGLSLQAGHAFPDTLGPTIMLIVTATTFVVQLLGPVCVKHGITKAGECGLDLTEDDVLRESAVADLLAHYGSEPMLADSDGFAKVVECFGKRSSLSCPVSDAEGRLHGVIAVQQLKEAILLGELREGFLACDLAVKPPVVCSPATPLSEAKDLFADYGVDTIPVVDASGKVLGVVDSRSIEVFFRSKLLALRERERALEEDRSAG